MMKVISKYNSLNNSVQFIHSVNYKKSEEYNSKAESLSRYEICYVEQGSVEYFIDGISYNLSAGDLIIVNTRKLHKTHSKLNEDLKKYTLQFKPQIFSNKVLLDTEHEADNIFAPLLLKLGAQVAVFNKQDVDNTKIYPLFTRLDGLASDHNERTLPLILSCILELAAQIHILHERNREQIIPQSNEHLKKVLDYIDIHLFSNLNLNVIAKELYLSPYYISHLFSKHMGVSIKKYINTKKILHAEELIQLGYPPTNVATRIGYSYYSTFFNTYKAIIGKPPSATNFNNYKPSSNKKNK